MGPCDVLMAHPRPSPLLDIVVTLHTIFFVHLQAFVEGLSFLFSFLQY